MANSYKKNIQHFWTLKKYKSKQHRFLLTPERMTINKNADKAEGKAILPCWWESNIVQPLWKSA